MLNSIAELIEVRPQNDRGAASMRWASSWASRSPAIDRPIDHHPLLELARPFHEDHGDAAGGAAGHGAQHARIDHGGGKALALQLELLLIDAAGDVGGQHQQQVDLALVGAGTRNVPGRAPGQHRERTQSLPARSP